MIQQTEKFQCQICDLFSFVLLGEYSAWSLAVLNVSLVTKIKNQVQLHGYFAFSEIANFLNHSCKWKYWSSTNREILLVCDNHYGEFFDGFKVAKYFTYYILLRRKCPFKPWYLKAL